jgi:starvation-inducible DNA-binding protein
VHESSVLFFGFQHLRRNAMSKKPEKTEQSNKNAVIAIKNTPDDALSVAKALTNCLATTYVLAIETLGCHWNVTGKQFVSLHALFEEHYKELLEASDVIAERVRALGFPCPSSLSTFSELSAIKQEKTTQRNAKSMCEMLLKHHRSASLEAKRVLQVAESASDDVTVDMMVARMTAHDKAAWMLAALLEE